MTLNNQADRVTLTEPHFDLLKHAERLDAHAALRASELRYRRLFEAARDVILILDPTNQQIPDADSFTSELLGYPHPELLGKELGEVGLLMDEVASREAIRIVPKTTFIRYEDSPLQTNAGHRRQVEFIGNVSKEDGQPVIQCNIRDSTSRKRTETALREPIPPAVTPEP